MDNPGKAFADCALPTASATSKPEGGVCLQNQLKAAIGGSASMRQSA
jgi:hypothetical protein